MGITTGKRAHSVPALGLVDSAPAQLLRQQASDQLQQILVVVSLEGITLPQDLAQQQQLPPLVLGAAHRVAFSVLNQLQQEAYSAAQQPQRHLQPAVVYLDQVTTLQRQEVDLEDLATAAQQVEVSSDQRLQSQQLDSVDSELPRQQQQALLSVRLDLDPPRPQQLAVAFSEVELLRAPDLEPLPHSQLQQEASALARPTSKRNNQVGLPILF